MPSAFILIPSTAVSIMDGPTLPEANAGSRTSDVFQVNPEMEEEDESAVVHVLGQEENEKEDVEENLDTEVEVTGTVEENLETEVEVNETVDGAPKPARNKDDEEVEENSNSEDEEESEAEDKDHVDPDATEDDDVAPTAAKKSDPFCLFTTGLGFSSGNETQLRTVVE
jgi:hypothetical protein